MMDDEMVSVPTHRIAAALAELNDPVGALVANAVGLAMLGEPRAQSYTAEQVHKIAAEAVRIALHNTHRL